MFLILFSLSACHSILARCDHDLIQSQIPNPFTEEEPQQPTFLSEEELKPIRIYFDLSNVKLKILSEAKNKTPSESIKASNLYHNLEVSLNNLADFSSRLLKVKPLTEPIKPGDHVSDIKCSSNPVNADLFIAVKVKSYPSESKILGQAFYSQSNKADGRPIIGGMYLNQFYFPETPQDENSLERLFFTTIFHEMCHVFGVSGGAMSGWINKKTGKRYDPLPITSYFNSTYQKKFKILHTPAAHQYAVKRFGISEFAPGIPSGIEIEDGGGAGTAGSHPESRVYLSETMCGIFVGYTFISNLTLALLDDTGWYDVNYSMGELYPWGDGRSLGYRNITRIENDVEKTYFAIEPLRNFINTAPQLAYPKHYMCWPGYEDKPSCHYDFRAKAFCSPLTKFDCNKQKNFDDRSCCKMKNFTNPLNWPIRGDREEFDYLIFKVPNTTLRCQDKSLNSNIEFRYAGEFYSDDSMCAMSTLRKKSEGPVFTENSVELPGCYKMICDSNNTLYVTVGNDTQICKYEDQRITFSKMDGYLVCPSPYLLCGMKSFLKRQVLDDPEYIDPPMDYGPESTIDDHEKNKNENNKKSYSRTIVIIAAVLGIVIGIIIAVVVAFLIRRYSSKNYGKFNSKNQNIERNPGDDISMQLNDSSSEEIEKL